MCSASGEMDSERFRGASLDSVGEAPSKPISTHHAERCLFPHDSRRLHDSEMRLTLRERWFVQSWVTVDYFLRRVAARLSTRSTG